LDRSTKHHLAARRSRLRRCALLKRTGQLQSFIARLDKRQQACQLRPRISVRRDVRTLQIDDHCIVVNERSELLLGTGSDKSYESHSAACMSLLQLFELEDLSVETGRVDPNQWPAPDRFALRHPGESGVARLQILGLRC
jgi:hypothetical protein